MAAASEFSKLLDRVAKSTGSVVNLTDLRGITIRIGALRLRSEQHTHYGDFCLFAKIHNRIVGCSNNKEKSKQVALSRKAPFWGCCPYGVWDLGYPVLWNEAVVAIFYLGNFRDDDSLAPVNGKVFEGEQPPRITEEKREELLRYGAFLADYVRLILDESMGGLEVLEKRQPLAFYREATQQYIRSNFYEPINLQTFAQSLGLHPNYLGQQIKHALGQSFSQLLNDFRLQRARLMLKSTDKSITEVAFECGFRDSNYFSTVFRAAEGIAPSVFRRLE